MKRSIINTIKILLLTAGFVFSLWYFMEWREIGRFAMSATHSQLERRGMRLGYSDVSGESDGFTVSNLTLNGMANISFSSITIRPRILASILSLAPVCDISFRGCGIQIGQVMSLGDGGFLLTAGRREILFENLRTNGDFSVNGYLTIDSENMRIGHADARLDMPDSFAGSMGMLQNFLPLVEEGGRWYLRRN